MKIAAIFAEIENLPKLILRGRALHINRHKSVRDRAARPGKKFQKPMRIILTSRLMCQSFLV